MSENTAEFTEESWVFSGLFILQCVTPLVPAVIVCIPTSITVIEAK